LLEKGKFTDGAIVAEVAEIPKYAGAFDGTSEA
jgi:hypothetical protein